MDSSASREKEEMADLNHHLLPENGHLSGENDRNEEKTDIEIDQEKPKHLLYRVNEAPPVHMTLMFALQQSLLVISSPLTLTLLVSEVACAEKDDELKLQVLSANFFMAGLSTFIMCTFGVRLPIFQGPASAYIIPLLTLLSMDEWKCPATFKAFDTASNTTIVMAATGNGTAVPLRDISTAKIAVISGSLMAAGVLHCLVGITGLVGVICRYVGPITIVPTIVLIGLNIFKFVVKFSAPNMGTAMLVVFFNLLFSLLLGNKNTPIPWWNASKGFHVVWYPFHQVFSLLLSLLIGWLFSAILTVSGALSDDPKDIGFLARTDSRSYIIEKAEWVSPPYPGKFCGFGFSTGVFINFVIASLLSVLDSIGDYAASARIARVSPPPAYAFNRGIAVEGILSILSGTMGCCVATVSYGSNIGAMGITRVVSRRVFQVVGLFYICFSILGKSGAFFITIPYPVLGGSTLVTIGIFVGVVLSYLQTIDLSSTRNVAIIGIALLLGLVIPDWSRKYSDSISTGSESADSIIQVLVANPSFVGGVFSCVMDNLVPGTLKERGLQSQLEELDDVEAKELAKSYDDGPEVYRLPYLPNSFRRSRFAKFIPIFDHEEEPEKDKNQLPK